MAHIVKRESLTLPDIEKGHDTRWDYLTVYDKNGVILCRSGKNHFEGTIRLYYDGLTYVAGTNGEVLVTYDSILEKFNKK